MKIDNEYRTAPASDALSKAQKLEQLRRNMAAIPARSDGTEPAMPAVMLRSVDEPTPIVATAQTTLRSRALSDRGASSARRTRTRNTIGNSLDKLGETLQIDAPTGGRAFTGGSGPGTCHSAGQSMAIGCGRSL